MNRRIKVLIVDDSALVRQILSTALSDDPAIEVVGTASDPICARQMIKELHPDVLTLDVEMPKMDGLTFLEKIMSLRPMPAIMVSSLTRRGAEVTMRALEIGAVDFVAKPIANASSGLAMLKAELVPKIKAAARARVIGRCEAEEARPSPIITRETLSDSRRIIALGASTGGVVALRTLLCSLPANCPGVLITQHMPAAYTKQFAARLNRACALSVTEASDGQRIHSGHAYVAPGGRHLRLASDARGYHCEVIDGPLVSGHRPSVDILFVSVALHASYQAVGALLTGMGRDGAEGLLRMRESGAMTFAQDESTCVVYGMPRAARDIGAVVSELPIGSIAEEIVACCSQPTIDRSHTKCF